MLEHLGGDHDIERVVGEGKPGRVTSHHPDERVLGDLAGGVHGPDRGPGLDDLGLGIVEGDGAGAAPRALVDVTTESGTHVEHALT